MPVTRPSAVAVVVLGLGQGQASEVASSLPASCAASAAATRARSASISSRLPRPTTSTRPGRSGCSGESFLKPPLASAAPGAPASAAGSSSPS